MLAADDAAPTSEAEGGDGTGGAGGIVLTRRAQKRAVIFFPTELEVGKRHRVRIRHDGTRFCVVEGPQAAPPTVWGRGLLHIGTAMPLTRPVMPTRPT